MRNKTHSAACKFLQQGGALVNSGLIALIIGEKASSHNVQVALCVVRQFGKCMKEKFCKGMRRTKKGGEKKRPAGRFGAGATQALS